jgi:hypothetical protein
VVSISPPPTLFVEARRRASRRLSRVDRGEGPEVMFKVKRSQKTPGLYARRLLEDERIHAHLANASARLRKAWARAARQPTGKAAEDQQIYDQVREAVASLRAAANILQREPQQKKSKRRGRKLVVLVMLAAAGALIAKRASGGSESRDKFDRPAEPVEPGRHDDTTAQTPAAGADHLDPTQER